MTQRDEIDEARREVIRSVRSGDTLMRGVADDVTRLVRAGGAGALSPSEIPVVQDAVRNVIARAFGASPLDATFSDLSRLVERNVVHAGVSRYQLAWDDLSGIMRRRDPALWSAVRRHLASAPFDERDELMRTYRMLYGPQVDRARLARSRFIDPARTWVDPRGYRLSDRIWRNGEGVRQGIDRRLAVAIRDGTPRNQLARDLLRVIDPSYAEVRFQANGRIVRTGSQRINRSAASAVRRLMRTEISRTNAQATIQSAGDVPGIRGLRFRLSGSHPAQDSCNPFAEQDLYGLGAGVYPIDQAPRVPVHPNCLCLLLHDHVSRDEVRRELVDRYREIALGVAA